MKRHEAPAAARKQPLPDASPIALKDLLSGPIPPWLMRFAKLAGRGINRFRMIGDGNRILLGISGGKDSLALALALSLRRRWIPIDYRLEALQIEWRQYPLPDEKRRALSAFFDALEIPFDIITADMNPESFRGRFDCYLCSRNRKRILFDELERRGIDTLAYGHHLDDIVETTLINLSYRGNFSTMMPVQEFFGGKVRIIRPLCEVPETMTRRVAERLDLPIVSNGCPNRDTNIRSHIKGVIRELSKLDRNVREKIYRSLWNVQHAYLPPRDLSRSCLQEK